jgi:hypothetical protein
VTDNGTTNGLPDPKSDTATVSFSITEINNAPTALGDTLTNVAEDSGPRTIPFAALTANDAAGPANTAAILTNLAQWRPTRQPEGWTLCACWVAEYQSAGVPSLADIHHASS